LSVRHKLDAESVSEQFKFDSTNTNEFRALLVWFCHYHYPYLLDAWKTANSQELLANTAFCSHLMKWANSRSSNTRRQLTWANEVHYAQDEESEEEVDEDQEDYVEAAVDLESHSNGLKYCGQGNPYYDY
jgi:hypothetical protein